jgi:hypothetical protein
LQLPPQIAGQRALLVVAHPGHELRVHGWLETVRPEVWVLTDGSGHDDGGRLPSTRRLLAAAGATIGPVFGRFSDRDAYALMMRGEISPVLELVERLAAALVTHRIDYVAGDACEGFNPVHDLCRLLVGVAVTVARRTGGRVIADLEFPLEGGPAWRGDGEEIAFDLDDESLERKLAAALGYAELGDEVERALRANGAEAFRRERFFRAQDPRSFAHRFDGKPLYEKHGEARVSAGIYTEVLRFREHFLPFAERLLASAEARSPASEPDRVAGVPAP